jgi:hypothetical protein
VNPEEVMQMPTNEQSREYSILVRLDELARLKAITTDPVILKYIEEREKVLRQALVSP